MILEPWVWLATLMWAISQASRGTLRLVKSSLYVFMGLYLAVLVLSMLRAVPHFESLIELRAWLAAGLAFALTINIVRTRPRVYAVMAAITLAGVMQAIWGAGQFLNADKILDIENMAIGTTGNSNYLGGMLAMFMFPLLGISLAGWRALKNPTLSWSVLVVGILLIVAVTVGLIYTDCQSAYIGAGIGLISFGAALLYRTRAGRKTLAVSVLAVFITLVAVFGAAWGLSRKNPMIFANLGARATSGRIIMWKATWLMIKDRPVLGTGIGTYPYYYLPYLSRSLAGKNIVPILNIIQNAEKPHNAYLQIWSETGSAGLAAFLLLLAAFLWEGLRDLKRMERPEDRFILLGIDCGMISFLTTISVSSLLVIAPFRGYFCIFLGLAAGWRRAAEYASDWEWTPAGWQKPVMAVGVTALAALGLATGSMQSLRMYRANVYWEKGIRESEKNNLPGSIEWYTRALKLTPEQHKLLFYRGSVFIKMASYMQGSQRDEYLRTGIKDLQSSVTGYSDIHLYTNLGNAYAQTGDGQKRVYWLKKAADTGLEYPMAHASLGVALLALDKVDEAEAELKKALAVNPDLDFALFHMGRVLLRQKRMPEAVAEFRKFLETNPDNPEAYINLGLCLNEMEKTTEAVQALNMALQLDPDNLLAMINIGTVYYRTGRLDLAEKWWRRVLKIDPGNPIARQNIENMANMPPP